MQCNLPIVLVFNFVLIVISAAVPPPDAAFSSRLEKSLRHCRLSNSSQICRSSGWSRSYCKYSRKSPHCLESSISSSLGASSRYSKNALLFSSASAPSLNSFTQTRSSHGLGWRHQIPEYTSQAASLNADHQGPRFLHSDWGRALPLLSPNS